MAKAIRILLILMLFPVVHARSQSLVIDHQDVAAFDDIPPEFQLAATNLRMLFMDRSVGGNISFYLDCLSNPWENAPSACKRFVHQDSLYSVDPSEVHWDGMWDRSKWRYEYWPTGCSEDVNCFIDFMTDRLDSFDVMGCQFSYLAVIQGSTIADSVSGFFGQMGNDNKASTYAAFAAAHTDKKIIWWTTSLARSIGSPEATSFNEQMRSYAAAHEIILFDVADILSHDPNGDPCFDNRDGVQYKDEKYPDDSLAIPAICPQYTTETDGGHLGSISAGGIRVTKAFWVLMARLAGWQGITATQDEQSSQFLKLYPNPASGYVDVHFKSNNSGTSTDCLVIDLQGKVRSRQLLANLSDDGYGFARISIQTLPAGMYILQVRNGTKSEVQKLVVY